MHSRISPDAHFGMEEMCAESCRKGLKEVVFTEHYEFYTDGIVRPYFNEAYLENYFAVLNECRDKFKGKLNVKSGMEFGQSHLERKKAEEIAERYPFDYLIGSVHKLDNVDLENMEYTKDTVDEIAKNYYESLLELSETGAFDCLGHLDLFKRHCRKYGFSDQYDRFEPTIKKILTAIIQRGKGIEINTSGLRQAAGETMPGINILKLYKELGGTIITAGSDSHKPEDVGAGFDEAHVLLRKAGFDRIAVFNQRRCSFEGI